MDYYKEYLKKKQDYREALNWNNLPNTAPGYNNSYFNISIAHCNAPLLTRCGQHTCGGKNYWESPKALNEAIKKIICKDKTIINRAIELLKQKELQALKDCQKFIDELQEQIDKENHHE